MTKELKGLDYAKAQVELFQSTFELPVSKTPAPLHIDRATSRAVWTGEEALVEFIHQSSDNEEQFLAKYSEMIAGLEKAKLKSLDMEYPKNELEKLIGQADAVTDALYFLLGTCVEMGIDPQPLLDIVQDANMAKLGEDGKPIFREGDRKIMKPEGWQPPEPLIEAEIIRQLELNKEVK
ncbi:hypothetical protein [Metabacillus sp. Hm71]|uniref:hypothetical protein n=1 Tax=Metabacillus sp. Hm71 TaxID=3450743 RepID=UPI003F431CF2